MRHYWAKWLRIVLSRDVLIGEYILDIFNALKSCSMSFKSGEYFGQNSNWWSPGYTNSLITFFIWIGELSHPCSSTLGFFNDGNKCWFNHCLNPTAFRLPLNIIGAIKSFSFFLLPATKFSIFTHFYSCSP